MISDPIKQFELDETERCKRTSRQPPALLTTLARPYLIDSHIRFLLTLTNSVAPDTHIIATEQSHYGHRDAAAAAVT